MISYFQVTSEPEHRLSSNPTSTRRLFRVLGKGGNVHHFLGEGACHPSLPVQNEMYSWLLACFHAWLILTFKYMSTCLHVYMSTLPKQRTALSSGPSFPFAPVLPLGQEGGSQITAQSLNWLRPSGRMGEDRKLTQLLSSGLSS